MIRLNAHQRVIIGYHIASKTLPYRWPLIIYVYRSSIESQLNLPTKSFSPSIDLIEAGGFMLMKNGAAAKKRGIHS